MCTRAFLAEGFARLEVQERLCGYHPAEQGRDGVEPDVAPGEDAEHAGAECYGWVERSSGHATDGKGAGGDCEANREAVVRVAFGRPGRGDVEDDVRECEREEEFDDENLPGPPKLGCVSWPIDHACDQPSNDR